MTRTRRVLAVCYGNLCRSPMAEGLLRRRLADGWRVASAGTHAIDGQPPTPLAQEVLRREHGIDIDGQRSRGLTVDAVRDADHVLAMSRQQARVAVALTPEARDRVWVLGAFAPAAELSEDSADPGGEPAGPTEIPDPIGATYEEYRRCAARLERAIDAWVDWLEAGADPDELPSGATVDDA